MDSWPHKEAWAERKHRQDVVDWGSSRLACMLLPKLQSAGGLLMRLQGHEGPVLAACTSPGAEYIVSGGHDSIVRRWDSATGETNQYLEGHQMPVSAVAASATGLVLSASWDSSIRVWSVVAGECVAVLTGHSSTITSVAVNQDGTKAISGSEDFSIRQWDVDAAACTHVYSGLVESSQDGHIAGVNTVAFIDAVGERAASGGADRRVCVWDLTTRACALTLAGHTGPVLCVEASKDAVPLLYSGSSDTTIRLWDVVAGSCLRVLNGHSEMVMAVAAGAEGRMVSAGADCMIKIWEPPAEALAEGGQEWWASGATQACVRSLEGHVDCVNALAVLPDGAVVSCSSDGTICMWDGATAEEMARLDGHSASVTSVCMDAKGTMI
eukprot:1548603-Prymnesium_polylepis.1